MTDVCMHAVRESYMDRSRIIDSSLVLEDPPEDEEDPWADLDGSAAAMEPQEWRPIRQLPVSSEEAMSNNSDMQLVFFGTSAGRMSRYRCVLNQSTALGGKPFAETVGMGDLAAVGAF